MARPFPVVRCEPRAAYDAVVAGAGIGGLTCAALLARAGLRVLLVEQHYMVGGYCSTFRRSGFTFDAATHFYPLLGNPDTISGRLLQDLGIATRWVKMDPVDHFHLPDGATFDVPADFATYRARLGAMFPAEAAALRGVLRAGAVRLPRGTPASFPVARQRTLRRAARSDRSRGPRSVLSRSASEAAAHGRLSALGLATVPHVVRVRFDAAAVVLSG